MEYFIGQILLFPYNFVPRDFMACRGQFLSISEYSTLFSLIGTKFGGNGISNFGLPDLSDAEPISDMIYCINLEGIYPSRD